MRDSLKVWFLASEVVPFAKTGGLADVAGSLPASLKDLGVDVSVGLPFYRMTKNGNYKTEEVTKNGNYKTEEVLNGLEVPLGEAKRRGEVLKTSTQDGIPVITSNDLPISAALPSFLPKRRVCALTWSIATTGKPGLSRPI